jgi:hypothetical protein
LIKLLNIVLFFSLEEQETSSSSLYSTIIFSAAKLVEALNGLRLLQNNCFEVFLLRFITHDRLEKTINSLIKESELYIISKENKNSLRRGILFGYT